MLRHSMLLFALSTLVFASACGGRARLRLSEVEIAHTAGNNTTVTRHEARYADDGTLEEVEQLRNGELFRRMTLSYRDGRLASIDFEDNDGDRSELELTWEEGRLTELERTDNDGKRSTTEIKYLKDDPSKLERTTSRRPFGQDTSLTITTEYAWDKSGRLEETEAVTVLKNDTFNVETTTTRRLEREYADDGTLAELKDFNDGDAEIYTYTYEDGRLAEAEQEAGRKWEVAYDDAGRMSEIEAVGNGARDVTELQYEDGSVGGGIIFTPMGLPDAIQFDLYGRSFPDIELLTFDFLVGGA